LRIRSGRRLSRTPPTGSGSLPGHAEELMVIKIDAFPQEFECRPSIRLLNRLDVISKIPVVPPSVLLSQKLYAILSRKRLMGRDVYDASWLLGQTAPDLPYLAAKGGIRDKAELLERLGSRIRSVPMENLVRDVEPFVPGSSGLLRVRTILEQIEEV